MIILTSSGIPELTSPTIYVRWLSVCMKAGNKEKKHVISCFPVGYCEIAVKIFFDLTLVLPVKIPIFMFLLSRLIACVSQPDGNMTSLTIHFSSLT